MSVAVALNECGPSLTLVVSHEMEYVDPLAPTVPVRRIPSTWKDTVDMDIPWAGVAFAATSTVRPTVALFAGEVTETTGGVPCAQTLHSPNISCDTKKADRTRRVRTKIDVPGEFESVASAQILYNLYLASITFMLVIQDCCPKMSPVLSVP